MPKTYRTILGDYWDAIAKKTLGNEMLVAELIKSNLKYRNIFIFPADILLTIPDVPIKAAAGLPPWKQGGTA